MNRRRAIRLFGLAGLALLARPGQVLADTADELASRAQDFLTDGTPAKAIPVLLEALAKDPRNDRVEALLGRAYFQLGDARQALTHFSMAVRLNPEDTLSRIMADTISQFPLPPQPAKGRETPPRRPSGLAGQARAERQELLARGPALGRDGTFRLLLDPGHGGFDGGTPGPGLREADVALDVSLRLARLLAAASTPPAVSLTRTADVALPGWARACLAGYYGADLLLSLHAARVPLPSAAGLAVYAFAPAPSDAQAGAAAKAENAAHGHQAAAFGRGGQGYFATVARQAASQWRLARSGDMALRLGRSLPAASPLPVRAVGSGPFRLLAEADAPAVLIEAGFLSSPGDAAILAVPEKRQDLAKVLAEAVMTVVREEGGARP